MEGQIDVAIRVGSRSTTGPIASSQISTRLVKGRCGTPLRWVSSLSLDQPGMDPEVAAGEVESELVLVSLGHDEGTDGSSQKRQW